MSIVWTNEAVDAALSQLKASRFSNMTHQEAMRQILYAASQIQELTLMSQDEPSPIVSSDGLKIGEWIKDKTDKWKFNPICYD